MKRLFIFVFTLVSSIMLSIAAEKVTWKLVKSTSELHDGDIITIGADECSGSYQDTPLYVPVCVITDSLACNLSCYAFNLAEDGTTTTVPYEIKLEAYSGSKWYLSTKNGYLYANSNGAKWSKSKTGCENNISINSSTHMAAITYSSYYLLYYPQLLTLFQEKIWHAVWFSYFNSTKASSDSIKDVYIYKKVVVEVPDQPEFTLTSDINNESANEFADEITIEITASDGADIYYTTDGTTPTEDSEKYSGPLKLTETTTISAIAVVDGVSSAVATQTVTQVDVVPEPPLLEVESDIDDATDNRFFDRAIVKIANTMNPKVSYYYSIGTPTTTIDSDSNIIGTLMADNTLTVTTTANVTVVAKRKDLTSAATQLTLTKLSVASPTITLSDANGSRVPADAKIAITSQSNDCDTFYTIDGSDPTNVNATKYDGEAIEIETSAGPLTIKATSCVTALVGGKSKIRYSDIIAHDIEVFETPTSASSSTKLYEYNKATDVAVLPSYIENDASQQAYGYIITATDSQGIVHALGYTQDDGLIIAQDANYSNGSIYLTSDYSAHNHSEFILSYNPTTGKYYMWRQLKNRDREYLYVDSDGLKISSLSDAHEAEFEIVGEYITTDTAKADFVTLADESCDTAYIKFDNQYVVYDSTVDAFVAVSDPSDERYHALSFYLSEPEQGTTAIDIINCDGANCSPIYYDIYGRRIAKPTTGFFIRRQGNSTTKLLLK